MLKQVGESSASLRRQNASRHNFRNLRAKVRSLLPPQMCPREQNRLTKLRRHGGQGGARPRFEEHRPPINRDFDKLTLEQMGQINDNKWYYLGNEDNIGHYDAYLTEHHPGMLSQKWQCLAEPPSEQLVGVTLSRMSRASSCPKTAPAQGRRHSRVVSSSLKQRSEFGKTAESVREEEKKKAMACNSRRKALVEEQRVRRQMSAVHLQRQHSLALSRMDKIIKEKIEASKALQPAVSQQPSSQLRHDIALLTEKLRKVCLKKRKKLFEF